MCTLVQWHTVQISSKPEAAELQAARSCQSGSWKPSSGRLEERALPTSELSLQPLHDQGLVFSYYILTSQHVFNIANPM